MKRAECFFRKNGRELLSGLLSGLCGGLFGAGGGAIAVLALERFCGYDEKEAHAAAISIMLPITAVSAAVYCALGGVSWETLLFAAPGAALGGLLGARLTGKISAVALNRLFAAAMLVSGVWMLL